MPRGLRALPPRLKLLELLEMLELCRPPLSQLLQLLEILELCRLWLRSHAVGASVHSQ